MFRDIESLKTYIYSEETDFTKGTSTQQYRLIRKVSAATFENLVQDAILRSVRMHYDFNTRDLIIKLMPSLKHNSPVAILTDLIKARSMAMGIV